MERAMMSNKAPNPWADIARADNAENINTRRERPDSPHNFFWTVDYRGRYGFRFSASSSVIHPNQLPVLSEIEVSFTGLPDGASVLDLFLSDIAMKDMFFSMCLDLMDSTTDIGAGNDDAVMKALIGRIDKWQRLLKRPRSSLLSAELQMGLWGEVSALRDLFLPHIGRLVAVEAWSGPLGGEQDFSLAGVTLVEVKTQNAASDRKIKISSVDQLDNRSGVLFLAHQKVVPTSKGMTLQGIIDSTRSELGDDIAAFGRFERNLLEYGFENNDEYDKVAYELSARTIYRIEDPFPRLKRNHVPEGVSHVEYCVEIGLCDGFIADEKVLIQRISGDSSQP